MPILSIGTPAGDGTKTRADVLIENLVDSTIVAGISGLSTYATGGADLSAIVVAFGLTFLIKLKDLRGIH